MDEWVDERGGEDEESDDEEHTLGTPEGHAEIVRDELSLTAEERAELDAGNAADLADWEASDKAPDEETR